ncbi:MAG: hypothetical protein WC549_02035 [Actinomycetota bacterium]
MSRVEGNEFKIKYAHLMSLRYGEHIPRKIKKAILGFRMNRSNLRNLLQSVRVIKPAETCFEKPIIFPFLFCPKCGCRSFYGTGNMTEYPEHYEYFYCMRCRNRVAVIDNSPFTHALECSDDNYKLD